eukprot:m51a1_g5203 hypothetical protein (217) ;mRNA; r:215927-216716
MATAINALLTLANCSWFNEPRKWSLSPDAAELAVVPDANTDFWRRTHYGFIADSGHVFGVRARPPFVARVRFSTSTFRSLYDQAGLMLRYDENAWVKCGAELADDGNVRASAVCTRGGWSDWSLSSPVCRSSDVLLRVTVDANGTVTVEERSAAEGAKWAVLRVGQLFEDGGKTQNPDVFVGPMCCMPKGDGFDVKFTEFSVSHGIPANWSHSGSD